MEVVLDTPLANDHYLFYFTPLQITRPEPRSRNDSAIATKPCRGTPSVPARSGLFRQAVQGFEDKRTGPHLVLLAPTPFPVNISPLFCFSPISVSIYPPCIAKSEDRDATNLTNTIAKVPRYMALSAVLRTQIRLSPVSQTGHAGWHDHVPFHICVGRRGLLPHGC